jgi:hypothetical protein
MGELVEAVKSGLTDGIVIGVICGTAVGVFRAVAYDDRDWAEVIYNDALRAGCIVGVVMGIIEGAKQVVS